MRVVIAGSSGFLGTALRHLLAEQGHDVVQLVRREPASPSESRWDPYQGRIDQGVVDGADAVVNLAGTGLLGNPHSRRYRAAVHDSRVVTTRVLAEAVAASPARPVFLAQSGSAWYGDQGDAVLTEDAGSHGEAFMTRVARDWEDATRPAAEAGARVCRLRTVPVLHRRSLVFTMLLPLFRLGLGARLGGGRQYFPVISLGDWLGGVTAVLTDPSASGPYNLGCPEPATNAEFTRAFAAAVHRPAPWAVPAPLLRMAAGPLAPELLGSYRIVPARLEDAGYRFRDRTVGAVVEAALAAGS